MKKKLNKKRLRYPTHMTYDKALGLNPVYAKYGGWLDTLKYQDGGNLTSPEQYTKDQITGDSVPIKSAIAYGSAFKNPSIKRMLVPIDNPYIFKGNEPYTTPDMKGEIGTHYMFSLDNYSIPFIQENPNGLFFNENANPTDLESIKFRNSEEAERFSTRYKEFSPAFKYKYEKGGVIKKLKNYDNKNWLDNLQ